MIASQTRNLSILATLLLLFVGVAIAGCGDTVSKGDGGTTTVDVEPDNVRSEAPANANQMLEFAGDMIDFVRGYNPGFDDGPESLDSTDSFQNLKGPGADERQDVLDFLEDKVFDEDNLESETDRELIYLIRGDVFCADFEGTDRTDCVADVEAAEVRVRVTSPAQGAYDAQILVGPARHAPAAMSLHPAEARLSVNLVDLKSSFDHLASVWEESFELPTTMTGTIDVRLQRETADRGTLTVGLPSGLLVQDGTTRVELGPAPSALRTELDRAARTITASNELGTIEVAFEDTVEEWNDGDLEPTVTTELIEFAMPALRGRIASQQGGGSLNITGLSFGNGPATIDVDGVREASLVLNPNDGRQFDATITEDDGGIEVKVKPTLDLELDMKFQALAKRMDDLGDWAADETLRATLSGADEPKVRFANDQARVLEGTLTLSSRSTGISHEASGTQCISTVDATNTSHPFEELEVAACQ